MKTKGKRKPGIRLSYKKKLGMVAKTYSGTHKPKQTTSGNKRRGGKEPEENK